MELKEKVVNYELKDTVDLMNSSDYKERFQAEYLQTKIRYDKLHKMLVKYEAKTLIEMFGRRNILKTAA